MSKIETVEAPSVEDFRREFIDRSRPAIITGAMEAWPARKTWSIDYLRDKVGDYDVPVMRIPDGVKAGRFYEKFVSSVMKVSDYLDTLDRTDEDARVYLAAVSMPRVLAPLCADVEIPPYIPTPKVSQLLWVGRKGSTSSLHYDRPFNLHAMMLGRKRFTLFDRRETRNLYPHEILSRNPHMSKVDIEAPDHSRFPRFKKAARLEHVLEPGEIIYIPTCWWHHVSNLDNNVGINYWWGNGGPWVYGELRLRVSHRLKKTPGLRRFVRA